MKAVKRSIKREENDEDITARTLASRDYAPLPDLKGGLVVLISGCHSEDYPWESDKSGELTGLFTFSLIEVLERGNLLDHQYTFKTLLKEMDMKVDSWSLTGQQPQCTSSHPFNLNSPFVL